MSTILRLSEHQTQEFISKVRDLCQTNQDQVAQILNFVNTAESDQEFIEKLHEIEYEHFRLLLRLMSEINWDKLNTYWALNYKWINDWEVISELNIIANNKGWLLSYFPTLSLISLINILNLFIVHNNYIQAGALKNEHINQVAWVWIISIIVWVIWDINLEKLLSNKFFDELMDENIEKWYIQRPENFTSNS